MENKRILESLNALLDEGLRKCNMIESLMDSIDKLDTDKLGNGDGLNVQ